MGGLGEVTRTKEGTSICKLRLSRLVAAHQWDDDTVKEVKCWPMAVYLSSNVTGVFTSSCRWRPPASCSYISDDISHHYIPTAPASKHFWPGHHLPIIYVQVRVWKERDFPVLVLTVMVIVCSRSLPPCTGSGCWVRWHLCRPARPPAWWSW